MEIASENFTITSYDKIKDVLGNVDLDFDTLDFDKKKRFEKHFEEGSIEMPIAIKFSDSDYDLVAGNTRLSGLIKNGIDPKIWVIDISNLQEDGQKTSDKNMDDYKKQNNPSGKVKDPFGLNQYARELAQGLE
jgi:hypothetical protein